MADQENIFCDEMRWCNPLVDFRTEVTLAKKDLFDIPILEFTNSHQFQIGQNESYYDEILSYVNGVLLPGGSVWFDNKTEGYVEAGRKIMALADKMNSEGDYFPVWGTCLGLELITYLYNNGSDIRVNCSAYNESNPLTFHTEAFSSKLFKEASIELMAIMTNSNVTTNFHHFCITPNDFANYLGIDWIKLSSNIDDSGLEYVSTIEHKTRPYYGTQWHPEKPLYEWGHLNIPHDPNTLKVSQYMANFVVNEARRNNHTFPNEETERQHVIYNFPATFGNPTSTYTQLYFFD